MNQPEVAVQFSFPRMYTYLIYAASPDLLGPSRPGETYARLNEVRATPGKDVGKVWGRGVRHFLIL